MPYVAPRAISPLSVTYVRYDLNCCN